MKTTLHKLSMQALLVTAAATGTAWAALPPQTPAQQQAAAAKKAQADAQAAKDKEALAASMDAVAARWRSRAAQQGWKSHAPVAIAAAPAVPATPAAAAAAAPAGAPSGTPPVSRAAEAANNLALGATPGHGAAPRSPEALAAAKVPVKSEKLGTAPASRDVKAAPTQAVPRSTGPTVQKGSPDASKK
jgi:hypothetical protein